MLSVIDWRSSNIILDPIFIFGFDMDVQGAALATILSQAMSCIWVVWFLCGKKTTLKIRRKKYRDHSQGCFCLSGAWRFGFCHAGQRECDFRVL